METYDPTIEDSYRTSLVVDGEGVVLDILDTAGQTEYSQLRELYMRAGRGFVLVFALDNRQSFADLPEIYETILRVWEVELDEGITVPVVICGNKFGFLFSFFIFPSLCSHFFNRVCLFFSSTFFPPPTQQTVSLTKKIGRPANSPSHHRRRHSSRCIVVGDVF